MFIYVNLTKLVVRREVPKQQKCFFHYSISVLQCVQKHNIVKKMQPNSIFKEDSTLLSIILRLSNTDALGWPLHWPSQLAQKHQCLMTW